MTRDEKKCLHPKADSGDPCQSFASCDQCGKCWAHCPHREEERAAARRKGGHATAQQRSGGSLQTDELPPLDSAEAAEVWCDRVGRAAATDRIGADAANAALRAVREWRQAREAGRVTDRLEAMQDALEEWRRTGDPGPMLELVDGGES